MRLCNITYLGALSVRLSMGYLVFSAACSARSSSTLYLLVVSIVILSHPILCPVVHE